MHCPNKEEGRSPLVEAVSSSNRFSTGPQPAEDPPVLAVINFIPLRAWVAADLVRSNRRVEVRRLSDVKRLSS